MEKDQIDIGAAELMAGGEGFFGCVDQAEVDDVDIGLAEKLSDLDDVGLQAVFESRELRPVGVEADTEQSHGKNVGSLTVHEQALRNV